jgi:hypothetical protein
MRKAWNLHFVSVFVVSHSLCSNLQSPWIHDRRQKLPQQ